MAQSINLIPQQEVYAQTKSRIISLSTLFAFFIVLVVAIASLVTFLITNSVKSNLKKENASIETLRTNIKSLSTVEISGRNLFKKYEALKTLFNSEVYFSLLLQEFAVRKPAEIVITDFSVKESVLTVSGTSTAYLPVANFMNNLLSTNFQGGSVKNLFKTVTLTSVSLGRLPGTVDFSMRVDLNLGVLKK